MTTTSTITAAQWREAAVAAFHQAALKHLNLKQSELSLTVHSDPWTAAVHMSDLPGGGKRIRLKLPAMKPGARLTKGDADALSGYWVHELAHCTDTDWAAWGPIANNRASSFGRVVNGLEDIRIEAAVVTRGRIPGAKRSFEALCNRQFWRGGLNSSLVNSKVNIGAVLAYLGRARLNGLNLARAEDVENLLTPANRALVDAVLAETRSAQSTADIIAVVDKLFTGGFKVDLPPTEQDPRGKQEPQDPNTPTDEDCSDLDDESTQGGEAGEAGDPGEQGETDPDAPKDGEAGQSEGETPEDGESGSEDGSEALTGEGDIEDDGATPETGGGAGGDDKAEDDGTASGGGSGDPDADHDDAETFADVSHGDQVDDVEPDKLAEEIAENANGGALTVAEWDALEEANQTTTPALRTRSGRHGLTYDGLKDLVEGAGKLKIQVRRLVKAADRFGWQRNLERGRLDPRALVRASMGARDVYKTADDQEGHTAAVGIVLDMSGSMGGKCHYQAAMAIHVAEAVEKAGAPVEVHGFTNATVLSRVKGANERVRSMRDRFVAADNSPGKYTPLAPAMIRAATNLNLIPADRRILFVLTDGWDDRGRRRVAAAVDMAQQADVEVMGLVIARADKDPEEYGFGGADAALCCKPSAVGGTVLKALVDQLQAKGRIAA